MVVYDIVKTKLRHKGFKDGITVQFTSAFTAGLVMACSVTPFDMVRTRVMNQPKDLVLYKGMLDCFGKIMAKEGAFALYKGFFPVWGRAAPNSVL
jgi:hypothetical protein